VIAPPAVHLVNDGPVTIPLRITDPD
jgi:D-Tyr-tRNAtyr deacylase